MNIGAEGMGARLQIMPEISAADRERLIGLARVMTSVSQDALIAAYMAVSGIALAGAPLEYIDAYRASGHIFSKEFLANVSSALKGFEIVA